jgi:hypothetical protein
MTWIISKALMNSLSLQEQVEEFLGENSLDGTPSAPLNGSNTQQAYCAPDKMTGFSRLSRFGMTYKPLTESRGEALLTLYLAGFLAKTSAQQEKEKALTESEAECGNTWQESLEKSGQLSLLSKTPLCSALEDSVLSSKTLPHWGTMLNGELYQQPAWAQTTKDQGCGLLPTPTCHNSKEGAYPAEYRRKTPSLATHGGGKLNPTWVEWLMGWPLGWTDLKPLETDKYLCVQQQHGIC